MSSEGNGDTIAMLNMIWASLSAVGGIFMITVFLSFKELRSYVFYPIIFLALSDLGLSLCFFFPIDQGWSCKLQATGISYFTLSSVLWTAMIANTINVVFSGMPDLARKRLKYYVIISFGLPVPAAVLPLVFYAYGKSTGWCNTKKDDDIFIQLWSLPTFYIPLLLTMIYNINAYRKLKRVTRVDSITEEGVNSAKVIRKLRLYPLILTITYSPALIYRIVSLFKGESGSFYAHLVIEGMIALNGAFNAFAYGMNRGVKTALKSCCGHKPEPLLEPVTPKTRDCTSELDDNLS